MRRSFSANSKCKNCELKDPLVRNNHDIDKYILGDKDNVLPKSSDVLHFVDELVDKALETSCLNA